MNLVPSRPRRAMLFIRVTTSLWDRAIPAMLEWKRSNYHSFRLGVIEFLKDLKDPPSMSVR